MTTLNMHPVAAQRGGAGLVLADRTGRSTSPRVFEGMEQILARQQQSLNSSVTYGSQPLAVSVANAEGGPFIMAANVTDIAAGNL